MTALISVESRIACISVLETSRPILYPLRRRVHVADINRALVARLGSWPYIMNVLAKIQDSMKLSRELV